MTQAEGGPLRVLTVGNLYPPHDLGGGYELVWRAAVAALRAQGHEVRVLTTDHRVPGRDDGPEGDVHRTLRWYWRDHAFPARTPWAELAIERHNTAELRRQLHHFAPDVVGWWSMGGLSLSLLETARRRAVPAVAFVHDDWLEYGRRTDAWHARLRRSPRSAGLAARVAGVPATVRFADAAHYAFVSRATRDHAWGSGLPVPDTSIAHSGIDAAFLASTPSPPWSGKLLYVGRVDRRKGIHTAVRALSRLPRAAELTVIGDGEAAEIEALRGCAREHGCAERVHLLGARSRAELPAAYAAADAVVFPVEWQEPWGLVPLEAMAGGRPVVATGRGGSAEYLRDGENALLFAAGDADALAHRVTELAEAPELRARLRAAGLETARAHTAEHFHAAVAAALLAAARAPLRRGPATVPPSVASVAAGQSPRSAETAPARTARARATPADAEPRLSAVLVAGEDLSALHRSLGALARQTAASFEVIVAGGPGDGESGGAAVPAPTAWAGAWPFPLRRVPSDGPGPTAARDAGWRAARAPLVLFLGTGARAAPDVVALHLALHARHPDAHVGALGRVAWEPGARVAPLDRWLAERRYPEPPVVAGEAGVLWLTTTHVSLKRAVLAEVDGFDAGRFWACGADLDLAYRLAEHGLRLLRASGATVYRRPGVSLAALRAALPEAAEAERRLVALRPHLVARVRHKAERAAAAGAGRGRAVHLARWIPERTPWLGGAVWWRTRAHYTALLAPAYLAAAGPGDRGGGRYAAAAEHAPDPGTA